MRHIYCFLCLLLLGSFCLADDTKIVFVFGSNAQAAYDLSSASDILKHPSFDVNRNTVFYLHGYVESPASATVNKITDAYIKQGTHNILVLDWSSLAKGNYITAVMNSIQLGPRIAQTFIELFSQGLRRDLLHLVGHSLGAHLAGLIGRTITQISNPPFKLRRISGLDPAFPLYYPSIGRIIPINKGDAILVDIIHTDAKMYGAPIHTGSVDFFVNGGTRFQPGCPRGLFELLSENDLCSHQRSVTLWAESVSNPSSTFYATRLLNKSMKIQMGINCPIDAIPGNYYLNTNSASPYSQST